MRRRPSRPTPSRAAPPSPSPSPFPWLGLAVLSGAAYLALYFHPDAFWYLGLKHYDHWFADTFALLASNDAVTQGLNPYAPNPLDYFGRPHVYSHWWLGLRHLGLTRADIAWLGPLIVAGTWLTALSILRPRRWGDVVLALAILLASPVLLALERANNDLLIFLLLAPVVPCLLSSRAWLRWLAPVLIAAAAGLKYYPAAAGLLLIAPTGTRGLRLRVVVGIGLLLLVAVNVAPDLAVFGPLAPKPSGWMSFGATSAFTTLGWTCPGAHGVAIILGAGILVWAWRSPRLARWQPGAEAQADWLRFVLGAVLLTGCFFASANFAYRWVFAIGLAPLLLRLARDEHVDRPARTTARVTIGLLVAVLWLDTMFSWVAIAMQGRADVDTLRGWIRYSFLGEQLVTWTFFTSLLLFLTHFAKQSLRAVRTPGSY